MKPSGKSPVTVVSQRTVLGPSAETCRACRRRMSICEGEVGLYIATAGSDTLENPWVRTERQSYVTVGVYYGSS